MSDTKSKALVKAESWLSLDTWAVLIAFLAAALIRFGLIPRVPW